MKKFRVKVVREDEYEIEFDENIINEEFLKNYAKFFYDYETLEEHAENLAQYQARFGSAIMEGYGVVKKNGRVPYPYNIEKHGKRVSKDQIGININVISEDDFDKMEIEVEEIPYE